MTVKEIHGCIHESMGKGVDGAKVAQHMIVIDAGYRLEHNHHQLESRKLEVSLGRRISIDNKTVGRNGEETRGENELKALYQ